MNPKVKRILFDENVEYDEILEYVYFSAELKSLEINKEFSENVHKASNKRQEEISTAISEIEEHSRKIERITSNFIKKISSKKTIKLIVKQYVKTNKMSQTFLIELLSSICLDILGQVSKGLLENKYNDELLELLFETITSENYLKKEFIQFVNTIFQKTIDTLNYNPLNEKHLYIFIEAYGQYLISLYLKQNDIDEKKKEIQQILEYSNDELKEKIKENSKKEEEYTKYFENERQSIKKEYLDEVMSDLKEANILENYTDEEINEGIKKILNEDLSFNNQDKKILDMYDRYFGYSDNKKYAEYVYEVGPLHLGYKDIKENNIVYYLVYYLQSTLDKYLRENKITDLDERQKDAILILFTQQFMNLLAYHIHTSNQLGEKTKKEMIQEFTSILLSNPSCKEHYNDDAESNIKQNILYEFTPIDAYYNRIISSVLYEIDDNKVSEQVIKILNKYYGKKKTLNSLIKEETKKYDENKMDKLMIEYDVNQFAVSFIYYYLEDRVYLASYCPFVRMVKNILLNDVLLHADSQVETCKKILTKEINEPEKYRDLMKVNKLIKKIVKDGSNNNMQINEDATLFSSFMSLHLKRYDGFHFGNIARIESLINMHEYEITLQLYHYLNSSHGKDFKKMKVEEQIKLIYKMALLDEMFKRIEDTKDFIPTLEDMEKDILIKKLTEENEELRNKLKGNSQEKR